MMKHQSLEILRCNCGIDLGYRFAECCEAGVVQSDKYLCTECAAGLLKLFALIKIISPETKQRFYHEDREARLQAHEETKTMNENLILIRDNGIGED